MKTAIAQHLSIAESQIKSVEVWASVLFVRFESGRPRFVSKKVAKMELINADTLTGLKQVSVGKMYQTAIGVMGLRTVETGNGKWMVEVVNKDGKAVLGLDGNTATTLDQGQQCVMQVTTSGWANLQDAIKDATVEQQAAVAAYVQHFA